MKRAASLTACLIAIPLLLGASPPPLINYQGVLRDTAGTPLDGSVDMVVRFWTAPTGGDEILVDRHTAALGLPVDVSKGLFSVTLGSGSLLDGTGPGTYASLSEVFRDHGEVYIGVQVGTDLEMTPRLRVLSTAHALNADRLDGMDATEFALAGHGHAGEYLGVGGGTLSGPLSLPSNGLTVGGGQLAVASGRVGVGTGSPQNPLHIAGSGGQYSALADGVHLGIDAVNNTHIELVKNGGTPYIDFNNSNSVDSTARIRLASSNLLEVSVPNFTTNGRFGVGTTSPENKLHVWDGGLTVDGRSTSSPISLLAGHAPNTGVGGAIDLRAGGGHNRRGGHVTVQSGNTSSWTGAGGSSDVTLRGGTVDGQTSFAEVSIQGGRAVAGGTPHSDGGALTLRSGNATGTDRSGGNIVLTPGTATGSGTPGRVGVGTASPQSMLHVAGGDLRADGQIVSTLPTGTAPFAVSSSTVVPNLNADFLDGVGAADLARADHDHDADYLAVSGGSLSGSLSLPSNGLSVGSGQLAVSSNNVGVGTSTPGNRLHVWDGGLTVDGRWTSSPINLSAGHAPNNGIGGAVDINAGGGYNRRGGHVTVQSGNTSSWTGAGGSSDVTLRGGTVDGQLSFAEVSIQGGRAVAGGTAHSDGGALTLRSGNATGTNRSGGNIVLTPGTATGSGTPGRVGVGTSSPLARLHVAGGDVRTDGQLVSTVNTGTAPLSVYSTTKVVNLNADQLDGLSATDFARSSDLHSRYSDGEAVSAMGALADDNPLHHDRPSQPEIAEDTPRLKQIALRKWYAVAKDVSFPVDTTPEGVLFDGNHIWVANRDSDTVTKLRASDGAPLGTFGVGTQPRFLTFDGANVWVGNYGGASVMKLRAHDGAILDTINLGTRVDDLEFDGEHVWVAHGNMSGTVTKIRASDGTVLGTFGSGGTCPVSLEFDGTNLWIANWCSSGLVSKMRPSDGAIIGSYGVFTCNDIAFDGENLWVTSGNNNQVVKLRASDGANLGTIAVGTNPAGAVFDGTHVWVANSGDGTVSKLRALDGSVEATFTAGTAPLYLAFDGANVWVSNSGSGTVSKM